MTVHVESQPSRGLGTNTPPNRLVREGFLPPLLAGAVVVAGVVLACQPLQGARVAIQPTSQTVLLGSLASLDIAVSGLGAGAAPSLGAFDIDVRYDPAILAFDSISFGDPVAGDQLAPLLGSFTGFDSLSSPGLISQFEISFELPATLDSLQPDGFILTRLWFHSLQAGRSNVDITRVLLGDSDGSPVGTDPVGNGSITVVVPEPAAATAMLAVSLGFAIWVRRERPGRRHCSRA